MCKKKIKRKKWDKNAANWGWKHSNELTLEMCKLIWKSLQHFPCQLFEDFSLWHTRISYKLIFSYSLLVDSMSWNSTSFSKWEMKEESEPGDTYAGWQWLWKRFYDNGKVFWKDMAILGVNYQSETGRKHI